MSDANNTNPTDTTSGAAAGPSQPAPDSNPSPAAATQAESPRNQPPTPPQAANRQPATPQPAPPNARTPQQNPQGQNQGWFQNPAGMDPNSPYEPNRRPDADYGVTTGMKIAWIALGFLLGVFGLLLIFFVSMGRSPYMRRQAFKFVIVGIFLGFVAEVIMLGYFGGDVNALLTWAGDPGAGSSVTSSQGSAF